MPEIQESIKITTPQISEMFQKFAFSFKSKALEFFTDDTTTATQYNPTDVKSKKVGCTQSYSDDFKQDPPQEISQISQKGKIFTNPQFNQTLITSIFATISSFEASYLQLQTAHVPKFDHDVITLADRSLVSHLQTLSDFKKLYRNYYMNPSFNVEFSTGSCLEFQVNENQHKLRALKSVFNNLQAEIDVKGDEVSSSRRKLEELKDENLRLLKRLALCCGNEGGGGGGEVMVSIGVFERLLGEAFRFAHRFTKVLIGLMKKAHWDLDLVSSSIYCGVDYVKKGHNRYALLSYVCLIMFQGFDLEDFGLDDDGGSGGDCNGRVLVSNGAENGSLWKLKKHVSDGGGACDGHVSLSNGADKGSLRKLKEHVSECGGACNGYILFSNGEEKGFLRKLKDHVFGDPMEMLRKDPNCEFSKFCERKYRELIHPTMESTIFNNLDHDEAFVNSWKSLGAFYESFVKMASSVWALHKLAFSFDPPVDIFEVERNVDFSMVYMEDVTKKCIFPCKTRPKVGFTVFPGFKIGQTIIQSHVYLRCLKLEE